MMDDKDKLNQEVVDEVPTIIIERIADVPTEPQTMREVKIVSHSSARRWPWILGLALIAILLGIIVWLQLRPHPLPTAPVLPVSQSAEECMQYLAQPLDKAEKKQKAGVTVKEDSINNVLFREYTLSGLRAELTFDEPSPEDATVYFYTHSADYRSDNGQVLDACVVDGALVSEGNNRSGFLAAVGDRTLIGVALNDSVLQYVLDNGGHFFRQFALVSDGQMGDTRLKGKVERRAIARRGQQLYYIESLCKESLYDFAEALCDYGYTDAIYITGGKTYCFYRDGKGNKHDIGVTMGQNHTPIVGAKAPFLVFKKRGAK